MKPVGCLNRLGSALTRCRSVILATVTTHQFQFRVFLHPGFDGLGFPIGKQGNHGVALEIHQHRAIGPPTAKRKVIHAQVGDSAHRRKWQRHDAAQNGRGRCRDPQPIRQACASFAAGGETDGLNGLAQPGGFARPGFHTWAEPFGKDFAWAGDGITAKRAHMEDELNTPTGTRQIGNQTRVVTAHLCRIFGAQGTRTLFRRNHHMHTQHIAV